MCMVNPSLCATSQVAPSHVPYEVSTVRGESSSWHYGPLASCIKLRPTAHTINTMPFDHWSAAVAFEQGFGGPGMVLPERMSLLQRWVKNPLLKWLGGCPQHEY